MLFGFGISLWEKLKVQVLYSSLAHTLSKHDLNVISHCVASCNKNESPLYAQLCLNTLTTMSSYIFHIGNVVVMVSLLGSKTTVSCTCTLISNFPMSMAKGRPRTQDHVGLVLLTTLVSVLISLGISRSQDDDQDNNLRHSNLYMYVCYVRTI